MEIGRCSIFALPGVASEMQVMLYDRIAPSLRNQCAQAIPRIDFNKAFPAPEGLEEYRAMQREQFIPDGR